jgi:hypothetical protein
MELMHVRTSDRLVLYVLRLGLLGLSDDAFHAVGHDERRREAEGL